LPLHGARHWMPWTVSLRAKEPRLTDDSEHCAVDELWKARARSPPYSLIHWGSAKVP